MWRLILFSLLAAAATARAATVDVVSLGPNKPSLVTVSGTFDLNDKDVFLRQIGPLSSAIVAFDSDGGSLVAGLQTVIGLYRAGGLCSQRHLNGHANRATNPARIGISLHVGGGSL